MSTPTAQRAPSPEQLFAHTEWLARLACALVGDAAAPDVVQDTYEIALRKPPRLDGPLRPWLGGVARNIARMTGRSRARRERRELHEAAVPAAPVATPEELVARVEMQQRVARTVLALPEPLRGTLLLRYFEDMSAADIARAQRIPAATVRSRLKDALDRLRAMLDASHNGARRRWALALVPLAVAHRSTAVLTTGPKALLATIAPRLVIVIAVAIIPAFATRWLGWWGDAAKPSSVAVEPGRAPPASIRPAAEAGAGAAAIRAITADPDDHPAGNRRLEGRLSGEPAAAGARSVHADTVTLNGSGSTFQKGYQEAAIDAYTRSAGARINYGGGGSGKGRQDLADMVVDFAGADSPYKDADLARNKGGDVLYFPILLGPITVSYNLDGVDQLQLSPDTLAHIFQRDIKKWNDKAIAADNPGVKLPDADIVVAHRSDGSGTTDNFTRYLADAAARVWTLNSGSTVEWPADTQAGNGNAGVAQIVKSTRGAIGYVDLSDAKASGLKHAQIENKAGKFIEPTSDSASAAGDGIDVKDNLLFSALNARGDAAYPITYQSWVIVYARQADKARAAALKAYLKYLLGDGQKLLKGLDFAPLPRSLRDKATLQLDKIVVK